MEPQKSQNKKAILKKKNKAGDITFPAFKKYYKTTIIKTVWNWHKDSCTEQWNRMEIPGINPHIYSQMIFHMGAKNT